MQVLSGQHFCPNEQQLVPQQVVLRGQHTLDGQQVEPSEQQVVPQQVVPALQHLAPQHELPMEQHRLSEAQHTGWIVVQHLVPQHFCPRLPQEVPTGSGVREQAPERQTPPEMHSPAEAHGVSSGSGWVSQVLVCSLQVPVLHASEHSRGLPETQTPPLQ